MITPVYNGARYLDDLIQSVQAQDYPRLEHIIVDDGSDDGGATRAVLERYPHLRWWSRENRGQYATMNEGLAAATGDLICFISADDICAPGAVRVAAEYADSHPELDGVYGKTLYIGPAGQPHSVQPLMQRIPLRWYRYYPHLPHCSIYLKVNFIRERDLWLDPELQYNGDYDWILRMIKEGIRLGYVAGPMALLRVHPDRASTKYKETVMIERKAVFRKHGIDENLVKAVGMLLVARSAVAMLIFELRNNGVAGFRRQITQWAKR